MELSLGPNERFYVFAEENMREGRRSPRRPCWLEFTIKVSPRLSHAVCGLLREMLKLSRCSEVQDEPRERSRDVMAPSGACWARRRFSPPSASKRQTRASDYGAAT